MAEGPGDTSNPITIAPDRISESGESFGVSSLEGNSTTTLERSLEHSQNVIVKRDVHLVLAGRSGVGKTTLASNIFGFARQRRLSANHITQKCDTKDTTKHGITLNITDTVGQQEGTGGKSELQKLARHTKKSRKVDLLVYCISVDPSSKFHDGNPTIMRSLSKAYGKEIWKHCIVVLTFSNYAWEWCRKNITGEGIEEGGRITEKERRVAIYKELMKEYADNFTAELKKLGVPHANVKEIFDLEPELQPQDEATIAAIPAGDEPDDPVLPNFEAKMVSIQDRNEPRNQLQLELRNWRDVVFIEIVRKCNNELKKSLLQYRYGADRAKVVFGTAGGAVGGLVAGTAVGAVIGIVGGPIGVGVGALIGGVAGGTTGIASGGSLSEQITKDF